MMVSVKTMGELVLAVPGVLGFVPASSLVLVGAGDNGALAGTLRIDLTDADVAIGQMVQMAVRSDAVAVAVVIVDSEGDRCPVCELRHRELAELVRTELSARNLQLIGTAVVNRIAEGGRWHDIFDAKVGGVLADPATSPAAAATVLMGRRMYADRNELVDLVASIADRAEALEALIAAQESTPAAPVTGDEIEVAIAEMAREMAAGREVADGRLVRVALWLADAQRREVVRRLAAAEASAPGFDLLWTVLARVLPARYRTHALTVLALTAYLREDGPLAGIALQAALDADPANKLAAQLDAALQTGLRPAEVARVFHSPPAA